MPRSSRSGMPTTHVITILDRSGSMEALRDSTIRGWNHFVDEVRQTSRTTDARTRITHTVFNHQVEIRHFMEPLNRLPRLDREGYVPEGMTALLDAVGLTLDKIVIAGARSHNTSYICQIVTDGLENASRHYSRTDIAERIGRLTAEGNWTFGYLGANHDVFAAASELNIPAGNIAPFVATPEAVDDTWRMRSAAVGRRMQESERGIRSTDRFYD